jgi:site-specific recombinase XerD
MNKLVDQYIEQFKAGWFGNTEKTYRLQLGLFISYLKSQKLDLGTFTIEEASKWILHQKQTGQRHKSINERVAIARRFLHFCMRRSVIQTNVLAVKQDLPRLKEQKSRRVPFTQEQYLTVVKEAMDADRYPSWALSMIHIAWHTGLRLGDVSLLEWRKNIYFTQKWIKVWPTKKINVDEMLIIPMEMDLFSHLLALYNNREEDRDEVLPRAHYLYRMENYVLDDTFRKIFHTAGLPDHTFHSFRHGFVTRLINAAVHPIVIASMTGQTIKQIEDYAHVSVEAKLRALNQASANPEMRVSEGTNASEF